jgi:hypothetical protein
MLFAGVDAGAKMLVELNGESALAEAATAIKHNKNAKIRIALRLAGLCRCGIFHLKRSASAAVCLAVWALSSQCPDDAEAVHKGQTCRPPSLRERVEDIAKYTLERPLEVPR